MTLRPAGGPATEVSSGELPPPLKGGRLRRAWNSVLNLTWIVVVAFIGVKVAAGLYYVLFEVYPPLTRAWHHAVPDSNLRHDYRDVGEGSLATLSAGYVVWNHWRPRSLLSRVPLFGAIEAAVSRLERALHVPTVGDEHDATPGSILLGLVMTVLYAVPGFLISRALVHLLGIQNINNLVVTAHSHVASRSSRFWAREWNSYSGRWPKKLIGVASVTFFGRRAARGLYDDIQKFAARRRLAAGRSFRWWGRHLMPPGYVARYNVLAAAGDRSDGSPHPTSLAAKRLWIALGLLTLALFGIGLYVLQAPPNT